MGDHQPAAGRPLHELAVNPQDVSLGEEAERRKREDTGEKTTKVTVQLVMGNEGDR